MARAHPGLLTALLVLTGCIVGENRESNDFEVDKQVALSSLVTLGDGHLQHIANHFEILRETDDVRSADWDRVRPVLSDVARLVPGALMWFALPDGSYWSVQRGKSPANLSDRKYWGRLMSGQTVLGDLVASKQTGVSSAIVAKAVYGADGSVVGALGSSVYLDTLSLKIRSEMRIEPGQIFYSLDAAPVVGLNSDLSVIFLHPLELGEPDLERAITEMLSRDEGVVTYLFRGVRRTVAYRKSPVSGWWYAFGQVME